MPTVSGALNLVTEVRPVSGERVLTARHRPVASPLTSSADTAVRRAHDEGYRQPMGRF